MGMMDRVRLAAAALNGSVKASWNWRGGTKSGHLFGGSKFKGALNYPSAWGLDNTELRDRSRAAYWDSTQARAMLGRLVDNVIGTGLSLEASPLWQLIGGALTEDERHGLAREIELRFALWASSHEPDASGRMSLYELQGYEFLNRLRDGETVMVFRYSGDSKRMSPLSIQFLLPEQISTPYDRITQDAAKSAGRRIIDGIEIDASAQELAAHVQEEVSGKFTRIPAFGPSGRRFLVHPIVADTLGAVRGTPILAPMIHELQKITDGTVAELEAMVLNAVMAVWVKPGPDAPASRALAGIQGRGNAPASQSSTNTETKQAEFDKPGLIIQSLKAGEEVVSFDSKRPNVNFAEFVRQITKHLSASIGVPIEVLEESFNANYSASRASLLLFWNTVERHREQTASQFLNLVYEAWFAEEVKAGRIQAPGFDGASPVIRRAWLNCQWIGDSQPSIDPQKEANADDLRIAQGATTRERVAVQYNGSDYQDNVRRLKRENAELAEANAPMQPVQAAPVQDHGADDNQDGNEDDSNTDKQGDGSGS